MEQHAREVVRYRQRREIGRRARPDQQQAAQQGRRHVVRVGGTTSDPLALHRRGQELPLVRRQRQRLVGRHQRGHRAGATRSQAAGQRQPLAQAQVDARRAGRPAQQLEQPPHRHPGGVLFGRARQAAIVAAHLDQPHARLGRRPRLHLVLPTVDREAQQVEAAADVGDAGRRRGPHPAAASAAHPPSSRPRATASSATRIEPPAAPRTVLCDSVTKR